MLAQSRLTQNSVRILETRVFFDMSVFFNQVYFRQPSLNQHSKIPHMKHSAKASLVRWWETADTDPALIPGGFAFPRHWLNGY